MKRIVTVVVIILISVPLWGRQYDFTLWYDKPASNWNEALFIGNGRLGGMIFGGWSRETIQLNEESLWDGCKHEADAAVQLSQLQQLLLDGEVEKTVDLANNCLKSAPLSIRFYQSFGELYIDFQNDYHPKEYRREQDTSTYKISNNALGIKGQIFDLPRKNTGEQGLHMQFAGELRGKNKGDVMNVQNNAFYVENVDEAIFYFIAVTDYGFKSLDCTPSIDST